MGEPERRRRAQSGHSYLVSALSYVLSALGSVFLFGGLVFGALDFPDSLVITFVLWMPAAVLLGSGIAGMSKARRLAGPEDVKERELLEILKDRGQLTAAAASAETTLTVSEADRLLGDLAQEGHLGARAREGGLAYGLWDPSHSQAEASTGPDGDARDGDARDDDARDDDAPAGPENRAADDAHEPEGTREPDATSEAPPVGPADRDGAGALDELLSKREAEVLALLATGRSNREIAGDLSVAVGTVKTHVNNIYRKLEARNRTEALARARGLGLSDRAR